MEKDDTKNKSFVRKIIVTPVPHMQNMGKSRKEDSYQEAL